MWEFLANNMQIEDAVEHLTLDRENDQFLVRVFQQAGFKGKALGQLNACQLYLQVTTVADITTGCGRYVTQSAWAGRMDMTRYRKYDWPNQGTPTANDWNLWREAVHKSLCDHQKVLRSRLGKWLTEGSTHWYYSAAEERLYHQDSDGITFYQQAPGNASRAATRWFHLPQPADQIPRDARRATVDITPSTVVLTGWAQFQNKNHDAQLTLSNFIQTTVHPDARWAIERFSSIDDGATIAESI
jgi:hypothetical protein